MEVGRCEAAAPAQPWQHHTTQLVNTLWVFAGPVIFVVGLCGNVLILLVMSRKPLLGTTASVNLRALALADICTLVSGMVPEMMEAGGFVFKELHPATCHLEKFFFYTSGDTSIWILVLFTAERFVAVCFPFHNKVYCSPMKSKVLTFGALVLAVAKNAHVFWTRGAEYVTQGNVTCLLSNCGRPTLAYHVFECHVRPWIVLVLVNILPFCIIMLCNVFIIRALVRLRTDHVGPVSSSTRQLIQMSAMCLSASFCFLICITPSIVLLIGRPQWESPPTQAYQIAKASNNLLVYVNHSVNFFLYCMTGKRFRTELVQMVSRCRLVPASMHEVRYNNERQVR